MPRNNEQSPFAPPAGGRPATPGSQSRSRTVKEGWSDRVTFPTSIGLTMTPNDVEDIIRVNDAFRRASADSQTNKRE